MTQQACLAVHMRISVDVNCCRDWTYKLAPVVKLVSCQADGMPWILLARQRCTYTPHATHTHPAAIPYLPADLLVKLKSSGGTLLVPSDTLLRAQLTQAGLKEDAMLSSHAARSALLASHVSYTNLLKVRCKCCSVPS